ncbi:MAG: carbon monoxide dehydrogenase [Desulfuromonadales bacterium]|nr:carbon monoxide dehydrogenase [Desulfuromonadales bacterium]
MRWGIGRQRYRVAPGLYGVGAPDADAPVLVTANYKMTFDLLRRELAGVSAWLLVLDTKGINVWCAAGKGSFGTQEVITRVQATTLAQVVRHRTLVVPQLGAPGVAAHEVARGCGFRVVYGPVRAKDLPTFLAAGLRATATMRRVTFSPLERLVLTPVELTGMLRSSLWVAATLLLLGGIGPQIFSLAAAWHRGGAAVLVHLLGVLTGAVLTPVLLPWLPGRAFAAKGALAGAGIAALLLPLLLSRGGALTSVAAVLAITAVSSWCAMHFTGATPFTSPSGVEKEMRRAIPLQLAAALTAVLLWLVSAF